MWMNILKTPITIGSTKIGLKPMPKEDENECNNKLKEYANKVHNFKYILSKDFYSGQEMYSILPDIKEEMDEFSEEWIKSVGEDGEPPYDFNIYSGLDEDDAIWGWKLMDEEDRLYDFGLYDYNEQVVQKDHLMLSEGKSGIYEPVPENVACKALELLDSDEFNDSRISSTRIETIDGYEILVEYNALMIRDKTSSLIILIAHRVFIGWEEEFFVKVPTWK